jgi:HD-like signal output (HDOD) protein
MVKELDNNEAEKFVRGIDIPVRPAALQEIMDEQAKADPDIGRIAKIIGNDVSLTASVIKTVNSPLFGLKHEVSSVQQAVALLGLKNVVNIVTSLSLRQASKGKSTMSVERFWDTASDVALLCAGLSKQLSVASPDEAYIVGLFHDAGIPLLMQKHADYIEVLKEANSTPDIPFTEIEDKHYNSNHAVVGFYLAKSWRIPERICTCILNHHEEDMLNAEDSDLSDLVAILKMAEAISHYRRRLSDNPEWERFKPKVLEYLQIGESEYEDLKEDLSEKLEEAA